MRRKTERRILAGRGSGISKTPERFLQAFYGRNRGGTASAESVCGTELARMLDRAAVSGKSDVIFVIGGSFGLSQAVKERADRRMSMSRMTFPHQLARVVLLEQVYRGYQILSGGKYHK